MRLLVAVVASTLSLLAADVQRPNIYTGLLDEVLPQVATGGGWQTTITLVNRDTKAAEIALLFRDPDGNPMSVGLVGQNAAASKWTATIPVNGSLVLLTDPSGPLRQGWAKVESSQRLAGMGIFGFTDSAGKTQEAVVPFSSWSDTDFFLPFDNSNGFVTALAVCHSETASFATSTTLTVAFYDESGNRILLDQVTLKPGQRLAFASGDRWPQLARRRGTIRVTSSDLFLSVLGLRFNPGGSFTSVHTLSQ